MPTKTQDAPHPADDDDDEDKEEPEEDEGGDEEEGGGEAQESLPGLGPDDPRPSTGLEALEYLGSLKGSDELDQFIDEDKE